MIYLDPQGRDKTREVARYLARQAEANYRATAIRRFNNPPSLTPIPDGWTPSEGGAAQQVATP